MPPVTVLDPPGFTCAAACTPQVHNSGVKEQSGNIQETFKKLLRNIQEIHAGNIQGYAGNIQGHAAGHM
jgi:hypothetical protein